MTSETQPGPADAVGDSPEAADAAEQMAAATQALRSRFPLLQGDNAQSDGYPA